MQPAKGWRSSRTAAERARARMRAAPSRLHRHPSATKFNGQNKQAAPATMRKLGVSAMFAQTRMTQRCPLLSAQWSRGWPTAVSKGSRASAWCWWRAGFRHRGAARLRPPPSADRPPISFFMPVMLISFHFFMFPSFSIFSFPFFSVYIHVHSFCMHVFSCSFRPRSSWACLNVLGCFCVLSRVLGGFSAFLCVFGGFYVFQDVNVLQCFWPLVDQVEAVWRIRVSKLSTSSNDQKHPANETCQKSTLRRPV